MAIRIIGEIACGNDYMVTILIDNGSLKILKMAI